MSEERMRIIFAFMVLSSIFFGVWKKNVFAGLWFLAVLFFYSAFEVGIK